MCLETCIKCSIGGGEDCSTFFLLFKRSIRATLLNIYATYSVLAGMSRDSDAFLKGYQEVTLRYIWKTLQPHSQFLFIHILRLIAEDTSRLNTSTPKLYFYITKYKVQCNSIVTFLLQRHF